MALKYKQILECRKGKEMLGIKKKSIFKPLAKAAVAEGKTANEYMKAHNVNTFGESLDKLVDGDLPWGWIAHNREFTDRIENEFNSFRGKWVSARNTPAEHDALKSLLQYMDDVQQLCDQKGECFGFWCSEILIGQNWKNKLEKQLSDMERK